MILQLQKDLQISLVARRPLHFVVLNPSLVFLEIFLGQLVLLI